ncbi:MAG: GNAT family N-acetyltransferase [Acidithiobacillus sp.]
MIKVVDMEQSYATDYRDTAKPNRSGIKSYMTISIRLGKREDADAAVAVLSQSIIALCAADHQGDKSEIAAWLSNKTAAAWISWVDRSDATVLVAELDGEIVGVGMVNHKGEVLLNYVRPDKRFQGISKATLFELESIVRSIGVKVCYLESTITAKKFYESAGYIAMNDNEHRMFKRL